MHGRIQIRDDGVFALDVELGGESVMLSLSTDFSSLARGLCGNFNGNPADDTITSGGIIEDYRNISI